MNAALEVDENVFVVDVLNVGNKAADTTDMSSLEAVAMTNSNDDGDGKDDVDIVDDSKKKTATIINNNKDDEKDGIDIDDSTLLRRRFPLPPPIPHT